MSLARFVSRFAAAGFIFPIFVTVFYKYALPSGAAIPPFINRVLFLAKILPWPSGLPLDLFVNGGSVKLSVYIIPFTLSILANVILYSLVGWAVWCGVNRNKYILYSVELALVAYVVFMIRL